MSERGKRWVYGTLDINFDGYFLCRLATDPDPTNEERGMSGYTMALANEDPLDQVIRLQVSPEWLERNARPPLLGYGYFAWRDCEERLIQRLKVMTAQIM